jgi:hypothetical protein
LEYLVDYASSETRAQGERLLSEELKKIPEGSLKTKLRERLELIRNGPHRDLHF